MGKHNDVNTEFTQFGVPFGRTSRVVFDPGINQDAGASSSFEINGGMA
jgi:hypothetical protein